MILYNMRERGPYEYDKFALNVLQIHNAVTLSEMQELVLNGTNKDTLLEIQKSVNTVYNSLIGNESEGGLTERIYLQTYLIKGEN